jgi:hypothetical protein
MSLFEALEEKNFIGCHKGKKESGGWLVRQISLL